MNTINYHHPDAKTILSETLSLLKHSPTAKALLEQQKPDIKILKGPLPQAFVHQTSLIYLRVPALQRKGRLEQAIDLAGALNELVMNTKDNTPPVPDTLEKDDTLMQQHYKNVSIYMKTFPIIEELESAGHKALKEMRLMGLGKIYQAWKTGASLDECARIYWSIFDTETSEE
ncbi:MAG: hypothetical protein CMH27_06115 [Micavibrio sp.]|nr:hypothetical protein [Micavibrio sp.]